MQTESENLKVPFTERIKSIPEAVGIRVNEEPSYRVLAHEGDIEIRHYPQMLLARTTVEGDYETAVGEGFTRLAKYIFEDNNAGEALPMTAPVFHDETPQGWMSTFVLPAKYNVSNVPKPLSSDILLVESPPQLVASYRYSGTNSEEKMREAEKELLSWVQDSGYTQMSPVRWAMYDPPFAVPFFKRNEAHVELQK